MTIHKTNELTGDLLNRAVAKALGWKTRYCSQFEHDIYFDDNAEMIMSVHNYNPVADWSQCGQLIEKFRVDIEIDTGDDWHTAIWNDNDGLWIGISQNKDLKTAICQCVVQSVFGDEVEL